MTQFVSYETSLAMEIASSDERAVLLLEHTSGRWWNKRKVEYWLQGCTRVEESVVRPNSWRTVLTLRAGESKRETIERSGYKEFLFEESGEERLGSEIGLKAGALATVSSKLSAELTQRERRVSKFSTTVTMKSEREAKLPAEPDDPNKLAVRSRDYQTAPTYSAWRTTLRLDCDSCHTSTYIQLKVYVHDGGLASRQVDHLSDGSARTIDTGITQS